MRVLKSLAVVGAVALLASCGDKQEAAPAAEQKAAAPAPAPTEAEKQALLASLPAPYNTADLENGRKKFALCRSCHTLPEGGPNMTGPNLHGVFGRQIGTGADYKYSDAAKNAGFIWDAGKLDAWLAAPKTFLPGNKMAFMGVKDPKDRADLIAYLKVETGYEPPAAQ